jgi:ribonuclease HIII
MNKRNAFTYKLSDAERARLVPFLQQGNFRPTDVPHTLVAVRGEDCIINVYTSGKCLVQGKGAEDFVTFYLEPLILKRAELGYEDVLHPGGAQPHMGVDESGKGDFFGPLVVVAAYVDEALTARLREMNVRDSKQISSDDVAMGMGRDLRRLLGRRYSVVKIGPEAYNRLYVQMRNVNTMLAWAHARAIENLLENVPDCPRAVSDQFGKKELIEKALMKRGRNIELVQQPRAESDPAVAAASVIARDLFLRDLKALGDKHELTLPKGASKAVRERAEELAGRAGPEVLLKTVKCHFRTTDEVLKAVGSSRDALGPLGRAVSRPRTFRRPGQANRKTTTKGETQ